MILAIDIGNTNIKVGLFDKSKLVHAWRFSVTLRTADEIGAELKMLLMNEIDDISRVTGIIMSSVQPDLNYTMEHACQYYFGFKPLVVGVGVKTGLKIRYTNPQEVGADRIVNCVAAFNLYKGPCIVVDFGTATTFNYVNAEGEFMGGCIAPGIKTSLDSLVEHTARLPKIELVKPDTIICRNTGNNMQAGLIYGYTGLVQYILARMKKECGEKDVKVVATGGLSELVRSVPEEKIIDIVDRSLTLKGLKIIYDMNTKQTKE